MTFKWILLPAFILIGCTQNESQQRPHQQALSPQNTQTRSTADVQACQEHYLSKDLNSEICSMLGQQLTMEQAHLLLKTVMSDPFMKNPDIYRRTYSQSLLWSLNEYLLRETSSKDLVEFVEFLMSDCETQDLSRCRRFDVFQRIHSTHELFEKYILQANNPDLISRAFLLGSQAVQGSADSSLVEAFSEKAESVPYLPQVAVVLRSNLHESLSKSSKQKIAQFLNQGKISLSLLTDKNQILNQIDQLQAEQGAFSFQNRLKELTIRRPQMISKLQIATIKVTPTMKFMDLVFSRRITDKSASSLLHKIGSEQSLEKEFSEYLKLKMALEIDLQDQALKDIAGRLNGASIEFLNQFLENIDPIRIAWKTFKSNSESLASWISSSNIPLDLKVKIKSQTRGLDITIKNYVEYPHMFYLAYLLSKKNFSLNLSLRSDRFSLDAADIFSEIINPKMTKYTWLGYTPESQVSKKFAILNSLSYFLSSDMVKTLQVNQEEFLSYIVKNLYKQYVDLPSQHVERTSIYLETTPAAIEFKRYCDLRAARKKVRLRIPLEDLRHGFIMNAFPDNTFEFMSFYRESSSSTIGGVLPFDLKFIKDFYEYANTDLSYVHEILSSIQQSLKAVSQTSQVIDQTVEKTKQLQKSAKLAFASWSRVGSCMADVFLEERRILEHVVHQEELYLNRVHSDMQELKQSGADAVVEILQRYQNSYLLASLKSRGIRPLDQISEKGYVYSQFDFIGRVAHYLQSYSPEIEFEIILPQQIEKSQFYRYTARVSTESRVRFFSSDLSLSEMITDAYRIFYDDSITFVNWKSQYQHLLKYSAYIENLVAIYKTNQVPSQDFFFKEYVKFLNYLKFNETEKKLLAATQQERLWNTAQFAQMFLDFREVYSSEKNLLGEVVSKDISQDVERERWKLQYVSRLYGLYDFVVLAMNEDVLGMDYWVKQQNLQEKICESSDCTSFESEKKHRQGALAQAEDFFRTFKDSEVGLLLFPFDENVKQQTYERHKNAVKAAQEQVDGFMAAANKAFEPSQRVDVATSISIRGPVISGPALNAVRAQRFNFQQKTQRCFLPEAKCF